MRIHFQPQNWHLQFLPASEHLHLLARMILITMATILAAACGGGSGDSINLPPQPTIASPAPGQTFKAGDTLTFKGFASDAIDGTLAPARLTWWVDLHHDTHIHPLQLPITGGDGQVSIPVRGETSDNIWYRFHLRATDSGGQTADIFRDIFPVKAQVTLATQPPGFEVSLDGRPVNTPYTFTGVTGIERDLNARNQAFNGRNYRFTGWSDSGPAAHPISTPALATSYIASFADLGPIVNQAPVVTLAVPSGGRAGSAVALAANASDPDGTVAQVEFFDGSESIGTDSSMPYELAWIPARAGLHILTARATDNAGAATESLPVSITIEASGGIGGPPVTLTAPANLASELSGVIVVKANPAGNPAAVEFQLDGAVLASGSDIFQTTLNTGNYASGQHVIRARGRDAAGNVSTWSSATVAFGGTRDLAQGFTKNENWAGGLRNATAFAQAKDGRFFVAEQDGRLRVVKNGILLPTPFVELTVNSVGERGLIGVALHPAFSANGWVYVYYTTAQGGMHNRISRFTANGDVASPGETILTDLPGLSTATNHNGGAMHFGVDGKLYVGVGDNANGARAQNLADPFGKMLRINDDGSIPNDNPFSASQSGIARAVWAYGLRNPFSFAVQAGTGRIHINDVGENTWEEINLGAPGANYGWPGSEGPDRIVTGITPPLFTYNHKTATPPGSGPGGFLTGASITGAAFYPDTGNFPDTYRGNYFFTDYVSSFVARLDMANNSAYTFARVGGNPVDLMAGLDGALYILLRDKIVRISAP